MTDTQVAENILRFYIEKNIQLECELKGETFDPEKFEVSFQTMLATDTGKTMIEKMAKSVKEAAE
jgi:hypothetical protein